MKNEKSSIQSTCAALGIFLLFLAAVIVYLAMYSKSSEKVNYVENKKAPTTQSLAFRAPSFWVDTKQEMDMTKYLQRDGIEEKDVVWTCDSNQVIVGSNGHIVVNDYGVTCNLTAKSRKDKRVSSTCQIQTRSKQDDLLYSVRNLNGQSPDSSKENDKQEIISADINNSRQIDVDELNYVPGKRSGKYKWDKTLFYTLEDADENNEEDNQINTYRVTHKKFIHAKTKNEIEYEIYHHPESDKVHKMVSIEKDETVLHITEYYFTDDGKVNFIYCYEDTNYVPSYAKLSKKGVRYLFHNDTMVNWRIVNAEGEINYCYGKKEKKALSEHKKVVEYSKLSQEKRKQYDNCEKVMLNRAYNTFEKVNHFEGVSSICGYVCDENGTGMADASVTLKSTEYNCDVYGGTTNDKGYYNILVPTREAGYELAVTKEDFTEEEIYDVEIDEDKIDISQQPVYLSEKSDTEYSYALEFYDALSVSSLEGVSVTIRTGVNHRDGEPVSQFYSENSRENLSLVSGMYTVQISKEGYVDTYETIFVSGSSENLTQLYLSKQLNENELRIVLTWGETPNDLDSHLFTPGNMGQQDEDYHVAYYQKDLPDGSASLDVDEREGYGPETVTIDSVKEGQYKYYVADFSNCSCGNEDSYEMSRSHAAVRVYGKDGLIQTFYVPANRRGVLWEVFEIRDGTIVPLQRYYDVIGDKTWWSSGK